MGVPYVTAYTATGVIGVMRTFQFNCLFIAFAYLARETGGAGTVIIENVRIPAAVAPVSGRTIKYNGWWVVPSGGILQVRADSAGANDFEFGAWGYEHV